MAGFESLYRQFGTGSGRDKSMLKNVYANPGKYTEQQIRDAYRGALRVSRRDERFYKDIGSDDEDLVFQEDRYNTARNTYQTGLNNLLIRAKSTPPPAPPKPAPAPSKPAPPPVAQNPYQSQIAALESRVAEQAKASAAAAAQQRNLEAQRAAEAAERARQLEAQRMATIAEQRKAYESQISKLQSGFQSQTQALIDKYGLQIAGMQKDFSGQIGSIKSSFTEQQAKQQAGFDQLTAYNQAKFDEAFAKQKAGFDQMTSSQRADFEDRYAKQNALFGQQMSEARARADRNLRAQQASQTANIQLGGSDQQPTSSTAGTQAFKRRPLQFNVGSYGALSGIKSGISGMVNI